MQATANPFISRGEEEKRGKKHNWVMPFLLGSPVLETDFNGSGKEVGVLVVRSYRADFLRRLLSMVFISVQFGESFRLQCRKNFMLFL